jgi:hypothetical protein
VIVEKPVGAKLYYGETDWQYSGSKNCNVRIFDNTYIDSNNLGMIRILISLLILVPSACNNSELFPEGTYKVSYTCTKELTENQKNVFHKFLKKIVANKKWFENYLNSIDSTNENTYNPKSGLTRKEFETLLSISNNQDTTVRYGKIRIVSMANSIHFTCEGRLSVLDSLVLYPKDSLARFKNYDLALSKTNKVEESSHLVKPNFEVTLSFKGPSGILGLTPLGNKYHLTVGRQRQNRKPILEFEGSEFSGEIDYHFKYSIVFE